MSTGGRSISCTPARSAGLQPYDLIEDIEAFDRRLECENARLKALVGELTLELKKGEEILG